MASVTIQLSLDSDQFLADVELLAQAAQRSHQARQRLLDLGDLTPKLVGLDGDGLATAGASQLRIRLELPDGFLELARAVRAGEFDGLAVED